MKFAQVIVADSDGGVSSNPATSIARQILTHAKKLAYIKIEVQSPGTSYRDFDRAFSVEEDETMSEQERKEAIRDLANDIVEICAEAQGGSNKPLRWIVKGFSDPESDKGTPKELFAEKFKVSERIRQPSRKETTEEVITGTNATLRQQSDDIHQRYMELAKLLLRTIEPVSTMAGNLAERIRPSDAEVASRVREIELGLEADIAKAEAINRRATSDKRMETLKDLFGGLDMNSAIEQFMTYAMHRSQQKAEEARRSAPPPGPPPGRPQGNPSAPPTDDAPPASEYTVTQVPPNTEHLCDSSRTLATIIYGREEELARELSEHWSLIEPLAKQTDEQEFARLAQEARAKLKALDKLAVVALYGALSRALGDPARLASLGAFLKSAGLF